MKSVPLITGGLSFLLSACSGGGGSFDVDDVSNPSSSKPRYQDDTSNQRTKSNLQKLSIPSLGGGMKLVAQDLRDKKKPSLLNEDDYISYFSSLSTIKEDVKKENKDHTNPVGSIDEPQAPNSNKNHHGQQYVYSGLYYIQSWRDSSNGKFYLGYYGYAYYFGNKTASALPVDGVATYKGTWSFITAAENGKTYELLKNSAGGQAYSRRSATPEDIDLENGDAGLTSEFSVDFGKKKLTGGLYYNLRKTNANESQDRKHKLYTLEADVHSNRFRGKVKPTKTDSEEHPFTSEGTLEGGFYRPKGEELGGKFLAGNKKVFGVFSAKEDPENKTLPRETLIDGKLTTFSTKKPNGTTDTTANATTSTAASTTTDTTANTITDAENFKTKDISSFGEADYLLIDNYPVPLLPESGDFISSKHHTVGKKTYQVEACCSNLSYVKFGMYYEVPLEEKEKNKEKEKKDKEKQATTSINTYYQFLLGHRTPSSQIPTMGNVTYRGSWFGYIGDDKTSYSATGDKQQEKNAVAEFNVDFDKKKLTGELKRHDNQNTVFKINADLQSGKNDFTGTATAENFVIDGKDSQGNTPINITTEVKGAFYGPKASELGGYFTYNGKNPADKNSKSSPAVSSPSNSPNARAAVVFGAKKQVETTK
ncbi:transferrin-binding protein-like solute binding protein [Haemophilus influenzae]|nr:transferrin-binding protein-like solute binding protein [Haemophilus influenzae]